MNGVEPGHLVGQHVHRAADHADRRAFGEGADGVELAERDADVGVA
jgi:hypothetical protein